MPLDFIAINVSDDNNLMYYFYTNTISFSVDSTHPDVLLECNKRLFNEKYYKKEEIYTLPYKQNQRRLVYSFTTHHHVDHSGGDYRIKTLVPDIQQVKGYSGILYIDNILVECIHTPCHTRDSMCILINNMYMCTGDTIFYLGCGRFFEGNSCDMISCINKIKGYDHNIILLYGHDYKESNIKFVESMYQISENIINKTFLTIKEEMDYNPFFRVESYEEMNELREKKNKFVN